MQYIYLKKDFVADNDYFNKTYINVSEIRDIKNDIIYSGYFPRLKQTKYRGLQAFKQVIKRIDDSVRITEESKPKWLNCFKLVFDCKCTPMIINDNKCLLFEDTDMLKIKKYFDLDENEMVVSTTEPTSSFLDPMSSKDKIKIIMDYIVGEELQQQEVFDLVREILTRL